jgi:hypothetical protein
MCCGRTVYRSAACTTEGCAFKNKSDTDSYFTCSRYQYLSHYKYEVLDNTTLQVCASTSSVPAIWRLCYLKTDMLIIKNTIFIQTSHCPVSVNASEGNSELPMHNNGREWIRPALRYMSGIIIIIIINLKHN